MVLTLVLSVVMMQTQAETPAQLSPIVCPMTGQAVKAGSPSIDYAGTRYQMCCGNCPAGFRKDPAAAIKSDKLNGKTFGTFLFDPISNVRIDPKKAAGSSDYNGVRYYFASAEEKKTFDADPKTFTQTPDKEVLVCAVDGKPLKGYNAAGAYIDIKGTRYYTCDADCVAKLKADNSLADKVPAEQVKAPAAIDVVTTKQ